MKNNLGYQKLPNNFFEIMRRRNLNPAEAFFAIYLRGKCLRYGNPFHISNSEIENETSLSKYFIRKSIKGLQLKGVLNFDRGISSKKETNYTMLDSVMYKPNQSKVLTHLVKTFNQTGKNFLPVYNTNNERITNKNTFVNTMPKNWKEETLRNIGNHV